MRRRSMFVVIAAGMFAIVGAGGAQDLAPVQEGSAESPEAIVAYWTPERMAAAQPRDAHVLVDSAAFGGDRVPASVVPDGAIPGFAPGWSRVGPQPDAFMTFEMDPDHPLYAVATGMGLPRPQHGTKPDNPRDGPYGPFQRRTHFGRYLSYPRSTIGKLFFDLDGQSFVCSASVINRNTLMTAGHCNSDGAGTFATNRLFCPSYNAGGINPAVGCWAVVGSATSGTWHTTGDPDYDYACLVTSTSGTVVADSIGDVTGWLGRAWNFSATQAEEQFGYPQAAPFAGSQIIHVSSTEWYTHDFVASGQISKLTGNDMTGGASGGPWILGWNHISAEWPDTDGFLATDPGDNWINGVNSHRRCAVNCNNPPSETEGVFWQEISSPPFLNTGGGDESEDVVQLCFGNGGT